MQNLDEAIASTPIAPAMSLTSAYATAKNIFAQILAPTNDRSRAQSNAVVAFSVRIASAALLYLMQIVLARWMGGFEYGIYVFVWTWVLILGGLAPLGLNIAAIRLVPEYIESSRPDQLRALESKTRLIAFLTGTAIALAGLAGLYIFEPYVSNYYVLPAYLALVCIPMYAIGDMHDGLGRGHAWMGIALIPPYIVRPLLIIAMMILAHEAGFPMVATTAVGAAIIATWTAVLIQLVAYARKSNCDTGCSKQHGSTRAFGGSSRDANQHFEISRWFAISLPLLVINACELLLQYADVLIVSHFLSPEQVGIYFAAAKTMSLIMFVHYAVGSAVANRFAALKARGDDEGLKVFVRDAVNWTFWPSLAGAIVLLALGKPLLSLFGDEFVSGGYPVMLVLVVGFLLRSAVGPSDFLLNMLGEQRLCAGVLVFAAVLNVILNIVLVPILGMMGAAIATATALSVAAVSHYAAVRYRLGIDMAIWSNLIKR